MSGDDVVAWLHENYPAFHCTAEDFSALEWISNQIGWADANLSGGMNWRLGLTPAADRNSVPSSKSGNHYAAMAVARAVAIWPYSSSKASGSGFRLLKAPQSKATEVKRQDSMEALRVFCESSFVAGTQRARELVVSGLKWCLLDRLPLEQHILGSSLSGVFFLMVYIESAYRLNSSNIFS